MPTKSVEKIKKLDLILFDFHNTLSNSLFYIGLAEEHPEISKALSKDIFANKENAEILKQWMKGSCTYKEFHEKVAKKINCDPKILDKYLENGIKKMSLNEDLVKFAKKIKTKGVKVVVFTDNMDPFNEMVVPHFQLNEIFDNIISSWDYRILKDENNGEFIDIILKEMGIEIEKTLLIDDSTSIYEIIKNKGGHGYIYKDYVNEFPKFEKWFTENFL